MPDGNEVLRADIAAVAELIGRTRDGSTPDPFGALPVWAPHAGRECLSSMRDGRAVTRNRSASVKLAERRIAISGSAYYRVRRTTSCFNR